MPVKREHSPNDLTFSDSEDECVLTPPSSPIPNPTKRSRSSLKMDPHSNCDSQDSSPQNTPTKPKKPRTTPTKGRSPNMAFNLQSKVEGDAEMSVRQRVAEAIVRAGLTSFDKKALERELGLSVRKQADLIRSDGKGIIYKVLMEAVKKL